MSLEMNPNGPFPGDSAFRRNSADVVARYLGGDPVRFWKTAL